MNCKHCPYQDPPWASRRSQDPQKLPTGGMNLLLYYPGTGHSWVLLAGSFQFSQLPELEVSRSGSWDSYKVSLHQDFWNFEAVSTDNWMKRILILVESGNGWRKLSPIRGKGPLASPIATELTSNRWDKSWRLGLTRCTKLCEGYYPNLIISRFSICAQKSNKKEFH